MFSLEESLWSTLSSHLLLFLLDNEVLGLEVIIKMNCSSSFAVEWLVIKGAVFTNEQKEHNWEIGWLCLTGGFLWRCHLDS